LIQNYISARSPGVSYFAYRTLRVYQYQIGNTHAVHRSRSGSDITRVSRPYHYDANIVCLHVYTGFSG
jgi:hypothetical protein